MKNENVKKMCVCAILAALYVGLDFLAVSVSAPFGGTMKLSISGLPVLLAAITFGPLWGAAVGFVGALLGQMITYGFTATTLLWVLPAVVRGFMGGLLFIAFKRSIKPYILIIEIIISSLIVTAINTVVMYVDSVVYSYPVALLGIALINRVIAAVVTAIAFALILPPIIKALQKRI